jgi:hypothetical protein
LDQQEVGDQHSFATSLAAGSSVFMHQPSTLAASGAKHSQLCTVNQAMLLLKKTEAGQSYGPCL